MSSGEGDDDVAKESADGEKADGEPASPEMTPQSQELRQQQYVVGVGVSVIAGFALAIGSLQQFPGLPEPVAVVAGVLGAGVVYWLVKHSLFPTEAELAGE